MASFKNWMKFMWLQRHRTNEVLVRTDRMVPWITGGLLARLKYDNAIKDERVN